MEKVEERGDFSLEMLRDQKDPKKYVPHEPTTLEQSGAFPKGWLSDEDPED